MDKFIFSDGKIKNKYLRLINREVCKLVIFIFRMLSSSFSGRKTILLGASNLQFFILMLVVFVTRTSVSIVLHGQVEALLKKNKSFASKLFYLGFKISKYCNVKFLYLSKHIEKNIIFGKNNFFCKHPLPKRIIKQLNDSDLQAGNSFSSPISAAVVGLIREDKKNCSQIYRLSTKIAPEICKLSIIGRLHTDFIPEDASTVVHKTWDSIYSEYEFINAINDVSIFLYFFNNDQYKATASATALDAIVHRRYAFCLPNEAITSFLDGYPYLVVCKDLSDMANKLSKFRDTFGVFMNKGHVDQFKIFLNSFSLESQMERLTGWMD
ncbi:hypothetical protein [Shewanella xiamenensis]|uniref:hypothetical protein n=1 Tax=Shewanella xiamenensis TaxID=332186 RepID=UPI00294A639B|nr:hypothetical protein [Shewanella xiamenensis]MDV5245502.1 hypothetical protein [Shewanella xiamenensis]